MDAPFEIQLGSITLASTVQATLAFPYDFIERFHLGDLVASTTSSRQGIAPLTINDSISHPQASASSTALCAALSSTPCLADIVANVRAPRLYVGAVVVFAAHGMTSTMRRVGSTLRHTSLRLQRRHSAAKTGMSYCSML